MVQHFIIVNYVCIASIFFNCNWFYNKILLLGEPYSSAQAFEPELKSPSSGLFHLQLAANYFFPYHWFVLKWIYDLRRFEWKTAPSCLKVRNLVPEKLNLVPNLCFSCRVKSWGISLFVLVTGTAHSFRGILDRIFVNTLDHHVVT